MPKEAISTVEVEGHRLLCREKQRGWIGGQKRMTASDIEADGTTEIRVTTDTWRKQTLLGFVGRG